MSACRIVEALVQQSDDTVYVYAEGLYLCSVCAPAGMSREVVEAVVNSQNPSGISSPWRIADRQFRTGQPNPTPCDQHGDRMHYLLSC